MQSERENTRKRVVIVGGGFAGLAVARALWRAPVEVYLIDRRNHHVFQPLLYQVATAALSPADIASPIRRILRTVDNCRVALGEPTGIDLVQRRISVRMSGSADLDHIRYDWLVLAAGATHSYFGHDEWSAHAPGLKSIEDATEIRRRILLAFEQAEYEREYEARRAALTFAIVGGGATGVELAGAIKEIAAQSIPRDFRTIDTTTTRVVLFEGSERLLEAFPPALSDRARRDLERMGVEVRLGQRVTNVTADGVQVGADFLPVKTVFWAAGVRASPLGAMLGVPLDRAGRVIVERDLSVPGHPDVFVAGDMAAVKSPGKDGVFQPVPGVAPAAIQMGRYVGKLIAREAVESRSRLRVEGDTSGAPAGASPQRAGIQGGFVYRDKGSMATIGRAKAVAVIGTMKFTGLIAWWLWGAVHVLSIISFRNRMFVLLNWFVNYVFFSRDARLITGPPAASTPDAASTR